MIKKEVQTYMKEEVMKQIKEGKINKENQRKNNHKKFSVKIIIVK